MATFYADEYSYNYVFGSCFTLSYTGCAFTVQVQLWLKGKESKLLTSYTSFLLHNIHLALAEYERVMSSLISGFNYKSRPFSVMPINQLDWNAEVVKSKGCSCSVRIGKYVISVLQLIEKSLNSICFEISYSKKTGANLMKNLSKFENHVVNYWLKRIKAWLQNM